MQTMEEMLLEKIAASDAENARLQEQLNVAEEALNFLIMGGA